MYDVLDCSLIDWSADDAAYLNKCLLGFGIIVCDKIGAGQVQLLWVILQNISQLRNEAGQLDCFSDLVLSDTEKFCYQRPGRILLARIARSLAGCFIAGLLAILARSSIN